MAECIGFCGDSHLTGPGAVSQQVILERERAAAFFMLNVCTTYAAGCKALSALFAMFPIALELAEAFRS